MNETDNITVAAAVLMEQYGVVNYSGFTPNKLERQLETVHAGGIEDISKYYHRFKFEGYYPYSEERLYEFYRSGHPCAILARPDTDDELTWLPVVFLDEDGGIVFNKNRDDIFVSQFKDVAVICRFVIR